MLLSEYREVTTCYSFTSPQRRLPVKVSVRGLFTFYIFCRFAYGIHFPIKLQKINIEYWKSKAQLVFSIVCQYSIAIGNSFVTLEDYKGQSYS